MSKHTAAASSAIRGPVRRWSGVGAAALLGLVIMLAEAQAQTGLPSGAGSTRPQQELEDAPTPKSLPEPAVPLIREQTAPEGAAELTFTFKELRIEGATALPEERLRADWPHEAGSVITVQEVFRFANAITRAYGEAGYALSFGLVPEQEIEDGVVVVRVVEGFIDGVVFVGAEAERLEGSPVLRRAERIAAQILDSRPLRTADLERYILLVDDLPGLKVAATLMAAPTALGGSTLRVEVTERRLTETRAEYNNSLPETLDRDVAGGWMQLNGAAGGSEEIRVGGWRSVASDVYWSVSGDASTGIGSEGLQVGLSGFYSKSNPSDEFLSSLEYLGETVFASLHTSYPVIRTRSRNLFLGASAALSNTDSEVLAGGLTDDKLRTVEAYGTYDFADSTGSVNYLRLGLQRGLDVLSAEGNSRANGDVEYTTATLDAQSDRPIMALPRGGLAARVLLRGQATLGSNAVLSSAECTYGGRQFGRGFEPAVLAGDHCLLAAAELRWTGPVGGLDADIYAFADGGVAFQKGSLEPGERRDRTAASAGTGIRLRLDERVSGMLEASFPIKKPSIDDDEDDIDDFRLNASLRIGF